MKRRLQVFTFMGLMTLTVMPIHAAILTTDAGAAHDGASLFAEHCVQCHDGSTPRAPHFITFNMMTADAILKVMNTGAMQNQASTLSPEQRVAVAEFLSEVAEESAVPIAQCTDDSISVASVEKDSWTGWGGNARNHRAVLADGEAINKADLGTLKLKWAFAYPGATRARSQPLVHDGAVFVGSQDGTVYALDLETGCAHWTYDAGTEVRTGLSIVGVAEPSPPLLVFGDFDARVHAISADTGAPIWLTNVASHPNATITGSVKIAEGTVYVPISSTEWATAADPGYPCCTFRGGVAALDVTDGAIKWASTVIPDPPKHTGEVNAAGAPRYGPSGAPVWNSPAIDTERGVLYVGTGEAYTSPASESSDAVIAMRLSDGEIVWRKQLLAHDAWNMACFIGGGANCPEENGPDLDIGAATILWRSGSESRLFVGQKSGDVYALDPNRAGEVVWHRKLGRGGFAGGVHWGMAMDGNTLFVPIADTDFLGLATGEPFPGIHALNPITGETRWYTPSIDNCSPATKPACDPGMSAAVTSTPELLFAGGFDGMLRAYDSATGAVLWRFNTSDTFEAVNGDSARGGSIESDGPVVAERHLLINSGYQFGSRMPGNALLVFAPTQINSSQGVSR